MDIKELKIVLDWASSKRQEAYGSRNTFPEHYEKCHNIYVKVKDKFDEECKKYFEKNFT